MMEIRLKLTFLENLFLCLCLLTGLEQANGSADVTVTEGSEAVLPCFIKPEQNIERDAFVWEKNRQKVFLYKNGNHSNNGLPGQDEQFKGRVSHFPDKLQFGDASIRIRDTKLSDSGTYSCDFSPDEPNRQIFYIKLVVVCIFKDRWEENIGGASPQPHITSLDQSRDEAKLQCDVRRVSPKPKVEWQDGSGNILPAEETQVTERGGNFIILQTTVTKTDNYRCVVTQEEICHQVSAETSVYIYGFPTGWIVGVVVLVVVVLFLVWVLYMCYKEESTTGWIVVVVVLLAVVLFLVWVLYMGYKEGPPTGWIVGVVVLVVVVLLLLLAVILYMSYKEDSQTETNGNQEELVELNRNHDTSAV